MEKLDNSNVLKMNKDNPVYEKYLNKREKFIFKCSGKLHFNNKTEDSIKNPEEISDNYYFLCFVTRKYFKDNILYSLLKVVLGLLAVIAAILIKDLIKIKKIYYILFLIRFSLYAYGLIMIPLSLLYTAANLFCFLRYKNYVTTENSSLSRRIIIFYKPETDKLKAINWKSVFKNSDSDYKERRRLRGW